MKTMSLDYAKKNLIPDPDPKDPEPENGGQ